MDIRLPCGIQCSKSQRTAADEYRKDTGTNPLQCSYVKQPLGRPLYEYPNLSMCSDILFFLNYKRWASAFKTKLFRAIASTIRFVTERESENSIKVHPEKELRRSFIFYANKSKQTFVCPTLVILICMFLISEREREGGSPEFSFSNAFY